MKIFNLSSRQYLAQLIFILIGWKYFFVAIQNKKKNQGKSR
jgi:putative Mn2+ efflux pump MntP